MKLILLQKIGKLGNLGDTVDVKPGFGRNFLVPQGKAVPATAANLAEFDSRRAEYEAKAQAIATEAQSRLGQLQDVAITMYANAATEGKLYGSITNRDIADALTKQGHKVAKSEVIMGEGPIRHVGEYEITLHLGPDAETTVKVTVAPEAAV